MGFSTLPADVHSLCSKTLQFGGRTAGRIRIVDRRYPKQKNLTVRVIHEQGARYLRFTLVQVGVRVGEELRKVNVEFPGNSQFPIGRDGYVSLAGLNFPLWLYNMADRSTNQPRGFKRRHKRFWIHFQLETATGVPIGAPIRKKVKTARARDCDNDKGYESPDVSENEDDELGELTLAIHELSSAEVFELCYSTDLIEIVENQLSDRASCINDLSRAVSI